MNSSTHIDYYGLELDFSEIAASTIPEWQKSSELMSIVDQMLSAFDIEAQSGSGDGLQAAYNIKSFFNDPFLAKDVLVSAFESAEHKDSISLPKKRLERHISGILKKVSVYQNRLGNLAY